MGTETPDVDGMARSVLDRIGKALGTRSREPDDGDDLEDYGARSVPVSVLRERVNREKAKRQAAEEALAAVQADVAKLAESKTAWERDLAERAAAEVKAVASRATEDLLLADLDVKDPLGRQTIRAAWETLPKDARPKTAAEWWQTTRAAHEAHLADPKKVQPPDVPRPLLPYLPNAPSATATKPANDGKPPPAGPAASGGFNVDSLPIDQGMDAFFAALNRAGP